MRKRSTKIHHTIPMCIVFNVQTSSFFITFKLSWQNQSMINVFFYKVLGRVIFLKIKQYHLNAVFDNDYCIYVYNSS